MKLTYTCILGVFIGCTTPKPEAIEEKKPEIISLLGIEYFAPISPNPKLDSNLLIAQENFDSEPSEENYIWLGRRTAYLTRYNEAIKIFSEGIENYPSSFKLYRHRGHRYISQRKFDEAISDFEKAVELMKDSPIEVEPDGQPNKLNTPLSNTQFNVWYHLALAHYLKGNFAKAEEAYLQCMQVSNNNDLFIATADWLYMTFRRQEKTKDAEELLNSVVENMPIVENDSYYQRLMLYKGNLEVNEVLNPDPESEDIELALATQGYGVGNWYLYRKDTTKAKEIFERVVKGKHFSAFGFIAAEAELARLK
jgi:tetratricopeptide (TPR) repeat protein